VSDEHELNSDAPRLRLLDDRARLGEPPGAGVPGVDQPGRGRGGGSAQGGDRALRRAGNHEHRPGGQFTAGDFLDVLREHGIAISMDGKGSWRDNVFVERLWKTIKYEHVYLHAYDSISDARTKIATYLEFYNSRRPHSRIDRRTPDDVYFDRPSLKAAA
jgi:transposase InsO family protein